jgi:spermidine synthase
VVLFGFQARHGYVYHEVSLVITAFMAGLTLGAAGIDRLVNRETLPGGPRRAFLMAQAGLAGYALLLPALLRTGLPAPELLFPMLALVAGELGGAEFPLAVALTRGTPGRVAGLLYGADLVGGCLGAVVTSTLLIPVLGLPATCYAVAALCLAGASAL